tara:strand:- start:8361 stop:8939 length:579 start_codon:yes stop_codon:yes gene_type:complete
MSLHIKPDPAKPIPDSFDREEPNTFQDRVRIAAATSKLLLDSGAKVITTEKDIQNAEELFRATTDPEYNIKPSAEASRSLSCPATVQHLHLMLSEYDHEVVQEAVQLRRYVTNKLLEDTNLADPRHRLRALELLGKISDVGLFSEKTEITVKHSSTQELEDQIRSKLFKMLGNNAKTIDASEVFENGLTLEP